MNKPLSHLERLQTATEKMTPEIRRQLGERILSYLRTELLCYREDRDARLKEHQRASWDPWLAWAKKKFGIELHITEGIMPIDQPETSQERLREYLSALPDKELIALHTLVTGLGSAVLGLAVLDAAISPAEALAAAFLEQDYQIEHWGEDGEVGQKRKELAAEIQAISQYLE